MNTSPRIRCSNFPWYRFLDIISIVDSSMSWALIFDDFADLPHGLFARLLTDHHHHGILRVVVDSLLQICRISVFLLHHNSYEIYQARTRDDFWRRMCRFHDREVSGGSGVRYPGGRFSTVGIVKICFSARLITDLLALVFSIQYSRVFPLIVGVPSANSSSTPPDILARCPTG